MFSSSMFVFLAVALVSLTRASTLPNAASSWSNSKSADGLNVRVEVNLASTTDCLYRIREATLRQGSFYLNNQLVPAETVNSMRFSPDKNASFIAGDRLVASGSVSVYHNDHKVSTINFQTTQGSDIITTSVANVDSRHTCFAKTRLAAASQQSQSQRDNVRFDQAQMLNKYIDVECRELDHSSSTRIEQTAQPNLCMPDGIVFPNPGSREKCFNICVRLCQEDFINCGSFKSCERVSNPSQSYSQSANVITSGVEPAYEDRYKCVCSLENEMVPNL